MSATSSPAPAGRPLSAHPLLDARGRPRTSTDMLDDELSAGRAWRRRGAASHAAAGLAALAAAALVAGPLGGCSAWACRSSHAPRGGPAYLDLLAGAGRLLPGETRATVSAAALARGGRAVIVGDVHACVDELQTLLHKVNFRQGVDALVLAGDVVGKGPAPAATLDLAARLGARAVRGNHDDAVLAALETSLGDDGGADKAPARCRRGGPAAAAAVADAANLTTTHRVWLSALPWTLALPDHGALVAHAGLVPGVGVEEQSLADIYTIKGVTGAGPSSYAATTVDGVGHPWAPLWAGPPHVVFGHDAARGLQLEAAATGLDTGCVEGGRLTALVLPPASGPGKKGAWPGGEIVQVACGKHWPRA